MSNQLISIALLVFCIGSILAWSQQPHITISKQIRTRHQRMILLASDTTDNDTNKEGENKLFQDNTNEESSFGVSYIGGGKMHMFNVHPFGIVHFYAHRHHVFIFTHC